MHAELNLGCIHKLDRFDVMVGLLQFPYVESEVKDINFHSSDYRNMSYVVFKTK